MRTTRRGRTRHRPAHARPSVLASTRSLVGLGGIAVLVGFGIAAGAAVAGGPAGVAARAAVPPTVGDEAAGGQLNTVEALTTEASTTVGGEQSVVPSASLSTSAAQQRDYTPASELAASGIPVTALTAYKEAATLEAQTFPDCGLTWPLLAGIGRVESDHGRFAGAVLHSDGLSTPRVIGIPLNGNGTALIRDTDGGRLDGDTVYDRAVGPMQFIPSTWAGWGVDANGDGVKDPFNIFDATAAAADYLCAAGRDLTTVHGQVQAILSYNYSYDYVRLVMSLERLYARGVGITVPVLPTSPEPKHGPPAHKPKLPPVDPGTPRGTSSSSTPTRSPSPSTSSSKHASSSSTPTPSPTYTRSPVPLPTRSTSPSSSSTPTPSPTDTASSTAPSSPSADSATVPSSPAADSAIASSDTSGSTSSTAP